MGQSLSRLFALLAAVFPIGQRTADAEAASRERTAVRRSGRRRRLPNDVPAGEELGTLGRVTSGGMGPGGRGSPSGGSGTAYFGSHFLMGGELYDTSKPEV